MIQVLQLGLIDYQATLEVQRSLVELRKQGAIADTLLLLEHSSVITLGRNAKSSNITASPELLTRKSVAVFECDRGGDVTLHSPGQLVGYPIFDLRAFSDAEGNRKTLGAVDFVRKLEEALIRACGDLGLPTIRVPGLTGVWTESERKLAAIGVHISRGVTSHGFALNVSNDLELFDLIVPCGIRDRRVTSMQAELRASSLPRVTMESVTNAVTRNFGRVFQRQIVWVQSLDDLAHASAPANQDVPAKPPAELRKLHRDEQFLA